ncbi:MAG: outer membrane protein transport protein [Rickettsiaceae bacterium]|nr:outer membrane protein transport protein [Rickettsiaceae bacterium]
MKNIINNGVTSLNSNSSRKASFILFFVQINNLIKKSILGLTISFSPIFLEPALATNGFSSYCIGPFKCATGGAGAASATSAIDGLINPALISKQDNNWLIDFKLTHLDLNVDTSSAPIGNKIGKQKSVLTEVLDFAAGISYNVNEDLKVALAVASSGGGLTKYKSPRTNIMLQKAPSFDTTAVYRLVHIAPTASWNFRDNMSIGVSFLLGYSDFKTDSASVKPNPEGMLVQTNGSNKQQSAWGYGARLGVVWDTNELLTFGASYSTPVWFKKFTKYNDILLGPINTPMNFVLGSAWHITPNTDFLFDIKKLFYKKIKALGTTPANGGLGWTNQTVFMIGVTQSYDSWSASIGYNYAKSPIAKDKTFANSLFPAIIEQHFTAGIGYKIIENVELLLGGFYAPRKIQIDPGTGDKFSQGGKSTRLSIAQYGFSLGTKYNF